MVLVVFSFASSVSPSVPGDLLRFWYEEGANNFYSSIDPSHQKEIGSQNAWIGGYNPSSGSGGVGFFAEDGPKGSE